MAKFTVIEWFFGNICFFSTLFFLVGFFSKSKAIMTASIHFLVYFGGGGFFVFGWSDGMIMAQIGHIFMMLAVVYTILEDVKSLLRRSLSKGTAAQCEGMSQSPTGDCDGVEDIKVKEWKQSVLGFLAGLIVFLFFLPIHQNYIKTHPELVEKFGDPKFEKNINN